jgi:hypothetical protein
MSSLKKFCVGFVGGCLAHHAAVPYPRLFHRVLSRRFEEQCGVRLEVAVSDRYEEEPRVRLEALLQEGPLDAVLLHRSNHTFFMKTAMVFVVQAGDEIRYVINPMFPRIRADSWLQLEKAGFGRCTTIWKTREKPTAPAAPPAVVPLEELRAIMTAAETGRFALKDLSWIAGDWCGLVRWAIEDELRIVEEVRSKAASAGLPLMVLGPGMKIGHFWVNRFASRLDAALAAKVRQLEGVSYASVLTTEPGGLSADPLGVEHHMDRIHFNAAGHALVANRLYPLMARLVTQRALA